MCFLFACLFACFFGFYETCFERVFQKREKLSVRRLPGEGQLCC